MLGAPGEAGCRQDELGGLASPWICSSDGDITIPRPRDVCTTMRQLMSFVGCVQEAPSVCPRTVPHARAEPCLTPCCRHRTSYAAPPTPPCTTTTKIILSLIPPGARCRLRDGGRKGARRAVPSTDDLTHAEPKEHCPRGQQVQCRANGVDECPGMHRMQAALDIPPPLQDIIATTSSNLFPLRIAPSASSPSSMCQAD